ncbi:MAG: flagellar basal body-associated FliL family protein [Candidatus Zixiibacteriota bacterium]
MAEKDTTEIVEEIGAKKKSSPILMYAIIAVVMIAAGYFVGQFMSGSSSGGEKTAQVEEESGHGNNDSGKDGNTKAKTDIYMMEDIIVNPSGTGGTRFLSVSIGFEIGSESTKSLLESREAIIKDALLTILGSKSIQQLSDAREKEITRFQIRKRISQLLGVEDLNAVYFTDFVLQ